MASRISCSTSSAAALPRPRAPRRRAPSLSQLRPKALELGLAVKRRLRGREKGIEASDCLMGYARPVERDADAVLRCCGIRLHSPKITIRASGRLPRFQRLVPAPEPRIS
ncbi:hypothetical protein ABLE91_27450 [Aquabacter sp. CN5-332]|uniref:hypothetical protein n=1 Tax=Aquabacter sp. CN5-332 TaxID=3156608 RepID=UPI0032B3EDD0